MSLHHSPRIVTNGLVLYLDAGNRKSYPGSGNIWTDMSGYENHADIFGTNVWNSSFGGQFDFGNTNQITQYIRLPHRAAQSTAQAYTFEFWMRPLDANAKYFSSMVSSTDQNYFLFEQNNSSPAGIPTIRRYTSTSYISYHNNEILQFCASRDNSNSGKLYKNGNFVSNSAVMTTINEVADGGWILNQEQDSVGGGFDSSQNYRGAFMVVKMYNRALSDSEILQNYKAIKGRYNL